MVCLRKAEKENIGRPAYALWNTDRWKKEFQSQVTKAYQLLKKYSDKAILAALNSYKGKNIYSLRVKFLEPIIKTEEFKLSKIEEYRQAPLDFEDSTKSKPRKQYGQKSQMNFLRGLDGKEKDSNK
tara:strand:- start:1059 stop:1436 length:378 start_codon:yes stop_codon:yes gene_type:complete